MTDTAQLAPPYDPADDVRDIYEIANLFPRNTGLPVTVWISPRGGARHEVRIRVNPRSGDRIDFEDAAVVAVRPSPRVVHGELSLATWRQVSAWVELNAEMIVDYWDGRLDTTELGSRLQRV